MIFAPVARYTTIRLIIALVASQGWNLHQMDRPHSCTVQSKKRSMWSNLKDLRFMIENLMYTGVACFGFGAFHVTGLYGPGYGCLILMRIDSYLMKLGFTRSEVDPNLYFKVEDDKPLILALYVDDLFLTGADPLIQKCKRELAFEFEMKGQGLEVWQKPREIFLSQGKYVVKILKRFGMVDCKPVTTSRILTFSSYMVVMLDQIWEMPLSFINSFTLMFLVNLCPNICFAVSIVSSYLVEPHWIDAKNLLRYLRGTITNVLRYIAGDTRLLGYTDADWAGSVVDRKSTSRCCFTLGSASISWMSRKQKSVALSTAEAKYIAASMASCEAFWL
eukprot:PITA_04561